MTHRFLPLLFIIQIILAGSLCAQVIIREKVVLTPKPQVGNKGNSSNTPQSVVSTFVMTKKGVLQMYYGEAQRLHSPVPTIAKLVVHRLRVDTLKADTVMTDSILGRYATPTPGFSTKPACIPDTASQWVYPTPNQPFTGMSVRIGDTVQFVYITTDNVINGQIDTLNIAQTDTIAPFGWNVTIGRKDNCRGTWSDMISGFIGVADTTIAFTAPSSNSVFPRYPGFNNRTDKNDSLDLQVQVMFNSSPMKNYWIRVDTTLLVDSGGHSSPHTGRRPMGQFLLPNASGGGYTLVNTFTRQTDSTGTVRFKYLASQFGGIEKITVRRLSDTTSFDTLRISTQVPGLTELPPGNHYILIGAPGDVNPCPHNVISQHYRNHFGTASLIQAIQSVATAYDSLHPGIILLINDMSLERGGLFDVYNTWSTPHGEHRLGKSADIAIKGIDQSARCVDLDLAKLREKVRRYTGHKPVENEGTGPHFHIKAN